MPYSTRKYLATAFTTSTRKKFHRLLQEYVDAGLTDGVLFGTDAHNHAKAFAAYESADFLSRRQLEGIFCRNAERFLGKRGYCDPRAVQNPSVSAPGGRGAGLQPSPRSPDAGEAV